jgi:hypothetical protein
VLDFSNREATQLEGEARIVLVGREHLVELSAANHLAHPPEGDASEAEAGRRDRSASKAPICSERWSVVVCLLLRAATFASARCIKPANRQLDGLVEFGLVRPDLPLARKDAERATYGRMASPAGSARSIAGAVNSVSAVFVSKRFLGLYPASTRASASFGGASAIRGEFESASARRSREISLCYR